MREIKFRAWHTVHNKMYEPKSIDVLLKNVSDDGIWKFMQYTGLMDGTKWENLTEKERDQWTLNGNFPSEWKGKEIYEGDVVRILYTDWASKPQSDTRSLDEYLISKSFNGIVEYEGCEFGLRFSKEGSLCSLYEGTHGRKEVIGNIYSNPELIKTP